MTCATCDHFLHDPLTLEAEIPGLASLSSALGSVRGDTGLCRHDEIFCLPDHTCPNYKARASNTTLHER